MVAINLGGRKNSYIGATPNAHARGLLVSGGLVMRLREVNKWLLVSSIKKIHLKASLITLREAL